MSKAAWWMSWPKKGTLLFSADALAQYTKVTGDGRVRRGGPDETTSVESTARHHTQGVGSAKRVRGATRRAATGGCSWPSGESFGGTGGVLDVRAGRGVQPQDPPLTFGGKGGCRGPHRGVRCGARTRTRPKFWSELEETSLWGRPCAAVRVKARDFETARARANAATREAMDCLNFVGSMHPYNHAWLRFPGEASSAAVVTPGAARNGRASASYNATGPIGPFALGQLRETPTTARLVRKLSSVLAKALARERRSRGRRRSTVSETLLAAVERAGRASIEREREQQFLLQAISLETAVLPIQGSELTHRLAVRVARLLAKTPERRAWIQDEVERLYDVRSAIVHSGSYEVADKDLRLLKEIAARTLLTLLRRRRLLAEEPKALNAMFEKVELGR